jgi:Na+-transporting NADH:ubiquinone oxidoreductase subunit B
LSRIQAIRLLALVPVLIAAVTNTGHQYLSALSAIGGIDDSDWRGAVVRRLGLDYSNPAMADVLAAGLVHVLPVLAMALLVGGVWEQLFAAYRRRPRESGLLVIAVLMTLLMPPGVSLVHLTVGMSFAIVLGKGIFGGEGKTFVNPALLGAVVMLISFPTALTGHPLWSGVAGYGGSRALSLYHLQGDDGFALAGIDWWSAVFGNLQGLMGTTSLLAISLGGALLIVTRVASWRLILGQVFGLALVVTLCNLFGDGQGIVTLALHWHLVLGSFAFGAVFLTTDAASAASTNAGRWAQGLIVGALIATMRIANSAHPDGVILAILMGSMLAPLIDHVVIWFNVKQRARGYG